MGKKVEVTAKAFDPVTGEPLSNYEPLTETIDLEKNVMFRECKTLTDVSEVYMQFWNRLPTKQSEMVLVQSLRWV